MASQNPSKTSMYPPVLNPQNTPSSSSTSRENLYPTIDMNDLLTNLFPPNDQTTPHSHQHFPPSAPFNDKNTPQNQHFVSPSAPLNPSQNDQNPQYYPYYAPPGEKVVSQNDKSTPESLQHFSPSVPFEEQTIFKNDKNTPEDLQYFPPSAPPEEKIVEETLVTITGTILHLIDKQYSVELAAGDLTVRRLRQGENAVVAVLLRVGDEIQWPLTKDLAAVKLGDSHYFFTFKPPPNNENSGEASGDGDGDSSSSEDFLSYGLTVTSLKGQEKVLDEFDSILVNYGNFSKQREADVALGGGDDVALGGGGDVAERVRSERCAAYWTALAPNVEEYSASAARMVAAGSGKMIKGILWCGDVTVDRLRRGNEVLKGRVKAGEKAEVSPETLKRIKRVKRVTKMTEKVAGGVLSGVVKVSGVVTRSVANSKAGKKFFSLLPGEMVLATLDGFSRICDAVEVAGKNVMSTSSTVTTEFVSHRYGEEAAKATSEGLDAAGHAVGTAWAVFKIRKALNPKSALKPTTLAKSAAKAAAAAEKKAKNSK